MTRLGLRRENILFNQKSSFFFFLVALQNERLGNGYTDREQEEGRALIKTMQFRALREAVKLPKSGKGKANAAVTDSILTPYTEENNKPWGCKGMTD